MLTREQYFPGQTREEQVALFIRRHWMAFFAWPLLTISVVFILLLLSVALWTAAADLPLARAWVVFGTSSVLLTLLFILLRAWMSYYLDVTIVTERRLVNIEQQGVFVRRISEQSLLRVQDVSARQRGLFQHFLNYGTLFIETAGDQPNFDLKNIPHPREIASTILDLHERLIQGAHGMETIVAEGAVEPMAQLETTAPAGGLRHPLEELRPYFPEPGSTPEKTNHEPPKRLKAQPPAPDEGELREGEPIAINNQQAKK